MDPQTQQPTQSPDDTVGEADELFAELDPDTPTRASFDEPVAASSALVPVPAPEQPRRERPSLWKRISMRRRAGKEATDGEAGEQLRERLETMEGQLAAIEDSVSVHFDQLEHRFTQLWEIEDALNQVVKLPEQLTEVGDRQKELARNLRTLQGRVRLLAALTLVLAAGIGFLITLGL